LELNGILQPTSLFPSFLAFSPRVTKDIAISRHRRRTSQIDSASLLIAKDRDHDRRLHSLNKD
jgi:hypothetical protein